MKLTTAILAQLLAGASLSSHAQTTYVLPPQSNGITAGIAPQSFTQILTANPVGAEGQVTVHNLFSPDATVEFDYMPGLSGGVLKQPQTVTYDTVCTSLGCAVEPLSVVAVFEAGSYTVTLNWAYTYSVMAVGRYIKRLAFEAHGTVTVD